MYVSPDNIYLVYQKQVKPSYRMDRIVNEIVIPSAPADVAEGIKKLRFEAINNGALVQIERVIT